MKILCLEEEVLILVLVLKKDLGLGLGLSTAVLSLGLGLDNVVLVLVLKKKVLLTALAKPRPFNKYRRRLLGSFLGCAYRTVVYNIQVTSFFARLRAKARNVFVNATFGSLSSNPKKQFPIRPIDIDLIMFQLSSVIILLTVVGYAISAEKGLVKLIDGCTVR
jgi:hypothetical protein